MGYHGDPNILRSVTLDLVGFEARIEELSPKSNEPAKLRISEGVRSGPLEITENELVNLLQKAVRAGILTPEFVKNLHSMIEI